MSRFFAALYVSEPWHAFWRSSGKVYGRARAIVMFDRVITGQDHRLSLNGERLDEYLDEVKK